MILMALLHLFIHKISLSASSVVGNEKGWQRKGMGRGPEAEVCVPRRPWTWQVRARVD